MNSTIDAKLRRSCSAAATSAAFTSGGTLTLTTSVFVMATSCSCVKNASVLLSISGIVFPANQVFGIGALCAKKYGAQVCSGDNMPAGTFCTHVDHPVSFPCAHAPRRAEGGSKLEDEHGGCCNVQHFASDQSTFELIEQGNWESIRIVASERSYFYNDPSSAMPRICGDGKRSSGVRNT